jgi:hypothetical protein
MNSEAKEFKKIISNKKCSVPLNFVGGILCQSTETSSLIPFIKVPKNINGMLSVSFKLLTTLSKTSGGFCTENDIFFDKDPSLNYDLWINYGKNIIDLKGKSNDSFQVELTVVDIKGCDNKDTAWFYIIEEPKIKLGGFPDICISAGKISLSQICSAIPSGGCWKAGYSIYKNPSRILKGIFNCDSINTLSLNQNADTGIYWISYLYNLKGCYSKRDTFLNVIAAPNVSIGMFPNGNNGKFCETDSNIILYANPSGGHWSSSTILSILGNKFIPSSVSIKDRDNWISLTYTYINPTTNCDTSKSLKIFVQSKPVISILTPPIDTVYSNEIDFKLFASYTITKKITWIHDIGTAGHFENNSSFSNMNPAIFHLKPNVDNVTNVFITAITESVGACPFFYDSLKISVQPKSNSLPIIFPPQFVKLYPNPTDGKLCIDFEKTGNYFLRIFNERGQLVFQTDLKGKRNDSIFLKEPEGKYNFEIYDDNGFRTFEKFILR